MDRTDLPDFTRLLPDGAQDHPAFMAFFLVTRRRVYARPVLADHWAWFSEGWDQHRQWATTSSSDFLDGEHDA